MDFNLICIEIQESLINNESITLPGIGKLVIESQSATFLQDGLTIAPPCKKLQFIPAVNFGQSKEMNQEGDIIGELSGRIIENLVVHGEFEVPGFGIFSKKGDSPITFTADPAFDFSPDNFALEAIALEEVKRPTPPQETAMEQEKEETAVPVEKPAKLAKTEPAEQEKKQVAKESDVEYRKDCRRKWLMGAALVIVLLAVLILFAILFKEDVMPLLQKILYTEEELEIIQKWAAQ